MITLPTLSQLNASIKSALETAFGITIPTTGRSFLRALVAVMAGKLKEFYLALGFVQKNIFPDTADSESIGGTLERFGRVKLGRNPFPAKAGVYEIEITGTPGTTIPALTQWKSDDDSLNPGLIFQLDSDFVIVTVPDTLQVRALTPGLESKLSIGDSLTATAPIAQAESSAIVITEITEPLAAETTEEYRQAILQSYRLEPQGGAPGDYRIWASDAQGVQRVYPYAKSGETSAVNVFVEATIADSIDGKGTPSFQLLQDVKGVIEFNPDQTLNLNERGRRPIQVILYVLPVTPFNVGIVVNGFTGITPAQQALLLTGFTDLLASIRPFVSGADVFSDKNDILDNNKLVGAIYKQIPGAVFNTVSFTVNGVPTSSLTLVDGNILYLASVSYT